ncbi:uncharacterized protein LOC122648410 [Telopea speciosissima]|uniref:uncharacterized protein LOC122648410 n=1 Tax=Telopea speciosissima TaxID=54955 RepID=UPI001CC53869|nr:uncharacterized protein LOC122648410 [Telopea speciosissima]
MSPRVANRRGDASAKKGSRGKKVTATSQPEVVPSIVSEESKTSESEVKEKLLVPKVEEMEEVLPTADDDKVVATEGASLTAEVAEEDSKLIEEVVEEKSSEIVSEDLLVLNGKDVEEEGDDSQDKQEVGERNDGDKENDAGTSEGGIFFFKFGYLNLHIIN